MKELLPLLPRPSRYLGNEWGAVRKDPAAVRGRIALAFPDLYEVGMSYLGQKILLDAVNAREELFAERVFCPDIEAAAILRAHGTPLATLETDTPVARLDAVGFSLTHELCYTNVLEMLDLARIPLRAAERLSGGPDENTPWPVVMAGGGACYNAEPLAEFLDLLVIGDGEEVMPELTARIAAARREGTPRADMLRGLAALPGVYVPSLFAWDGPGKPVRPLDPAHPRVEKAIVADLSALPIPAAPAVPFGQAVHDRFSLELARGCTRGCRFCHAGMTYRPVRERAPKDLDRALTRAVAATGFEEVSLLSLSTGDYSALETLFDTVFDRCAAEQVSISLPSLRVGSLSEHIMERIASIRRTGATIAPEAGSQRLRDVINKGVTEEGLIEHVRTLFENGWQQVKLYFMIGLPTETDADLDAIADLCVKCRDAAGRHVKRLQITAAVSPFVPKTHTPFQWAGQISMEEIRRRVYYLKDALKPYKRVTLKYHQPEMSFLEGVLSRGDRRLSPVLESAWRKGAVFSSWRDHLRLEPYLEALAEHGLTPGEFQGPRDIDAPLPWDHLSCGVSKRFLLAERERALAAKVSGDCRYGACRNCGVCNMEGRVSELTVQAAEKDIHPRVFFSHRDQEASPLSMSTQDVPATPHGDEIPVAAPLLNAPASPHGEGGAEQPGSRVQAPVAGASPLSSSAQNDPVSPHGEDDAEQPGSRVQAPVSGASPLSNSALDAPATPHGDEIPAAGPLLNAPASPRGDAAATDAPGAPAGQPRSGQQPKRDGNGHPLPPDLGLSDRKAQYRIWYEKRAEAAYLSQLELQSVLERAMRRARFPLSFSAGFHPMPRISFGRALPVGVESDCEWFTLTLREHLPAQRVLGGLAEQMPHGLAPTRIEALPPFQRPEQAVRERFLVRYEGAAEDVARWRDGWARFMERDVVMFDRKSKNGPKPTNLRALVAEAKVREDGRVALTLDWTGDYMSPRALVLAVGEPISPLAAHVLKVDQEFAAK